MEVSQFTWLHIAALLALIYLVVVHPWTEHMTNADVQKKHATLKSSPDPAIRGPLVPALDPNAPSPTDSSSKNGNGVYPDIYGPEELKKPGGRDHGGGDSSDPPPYDFVPAAEFPAGPSEPAPFLNDFSKILKT